MACAVEVCAVEPSAQEEPRVAAGLCEVCFQKCRDRRLLPCLHTLCKDCVTALLVTDGERTISCPFCRAVCTMPEKGVDGLPRVSTVGDNELPTAAKCSMCSGEDLESTHSVDWWCEECEVGLCDGHIAAHKRTSKDKRHVVISFQYARSGLAARDGAQACAEHGEPLRLYCGPCDTAICSDCGFFGDHKDHRPISRICDILEERKVVVGKKVDSLQELVVLLERSLQLVGHACAVTEQRAAEVTAEIQLARQKVVQAVEGHTCEMLQQVEDVKENSLKVLREQEDELNADLSAIQNAVRFSQGMLPQCRAAGGLFSLRALDNRVTGFLSQEIIEQPGRHLHLFFNHVHEDVLSSRTKAIVGEVVHQEASPMHSVVTGGPQISAFATHGAEFGIQLKDTNNEALTMGGDVLRAKWLQTSGPTFPDIKVVDNRNGSYTVSCAPASVGSYTLDLFVNGKNIDRQKTITYKSFQWASEKSHPDVTVSEGGQKASLHKGGMYCSVVGIPAMRTGVHTWKIRFSDSDASAGVAFQPLSAKRYNDSRKSAYCWYGLDGQFDGARGVQQNKKSCAWSAGHTIQIHLDCGRHTLQITNLRSKESAALAGLPAMEYTPFISMCNDDSVAEFC